MLQSHNVLLLAFRLSEQLQDALNNFNIKTEETVWNDPSGEGRSDQKNYPTRAQDPLEKPWRKKESARAIKKREEQQKLEEGLFVHVPHMRTYKVSLLSKTCFLFPDRKR